MVAVVAALAGGIASIAGFGIDRLLTPRRLSIYGMKTAAGAVAIPHVIATLLRFWRLRSEVCRRGVTCGSADPCLGESASDDCARNTARTPFWLTEVTGKQGPDLQPQKRLL